MMTITSIIAYIVGSGVIGVLAYMCWISSVMISERNYLRKLTGAYYDFDIDEELKKMGLTRTQALKKYKPGVFDKSKVKYFDGDNT